MPVIGYLYVGSPEASAGLTAGFGKGLRETGHVEGQNVSVEYRWAYSNYDRLPELAADLVRRRVAVIITPGSAPAALAAKAATTTIPIVFQTGADPVQAGLVGSLNQPGGNITGISSMNSELGGKRLGLLQELLPKAVRFGVLVNPGALYRAELFIADAQAAGAALGQQIEVFTTSSNREIDEAFATIAQKRIDGLMVTPSPLFSNRRVQLATLAMLHRMPTIFSDDDIAEAGGLASYGSSLVDQFRLAGIYAGRILNGEKPADLPVMRASKFEFVINLHTAKLLGLEVPPMLLARADKVID
jgi:putative ABC transport system substrate-binding protein